MTVQYEIYTIETEGLTLSRLIWNRFKRPMFGMVERVWELNQNLASTGPFLVLGSKVTIPIDFEQPNVPVRAVIQLWD